MHYIIFIACVFVIAEGLDLDVVVNNNGVEFDAKNKCLPGGTPCYIKCCAYAQVMHYSRSSISCINKTDKRDLIDLSSVEDELKNYSDYLSATKESDVMLYRRKTEFRVGVDVLLYMDSDFEDVENNVKAVVLDTGDNVEVTPPKYCSEMFVAYDTVNNITFTFTGILVNLDDNTAYITKVKFSAYGGLVSAFFIFLVLIVYSLLKSLRSNVYGVISMWFFASLMMVQLIDSWITIYEYWLVEQGREEEKLQFCPWLSPIVYFLILSTFFCINAMCFEIWRTFKKSTLVSSDSASRCRLAKRVYALYALTGPAVLTAVAVAIERADVPAYISKPGFETCMHDTEDKIIRLYKYLPMGVLVLASVVLYGLTIYNIWTVNKMSQGMTSTQDKKNKKQFAVYGRLAVLMGVNWILEIVEGMVTYDIPVWLEYIVDFYNIFIGVVIFFTMVFKRSIFVKLCERLNIENRWVRQSTKVTSSQNYKSSRSNARRKTIDDSIQFESINASQFDKPFSPSPRYHVVQCND